MARWCRAVQALVAVSAVAVIASSGLSSGSAEGASRSGWAWPKAWAEYQIEKKFPGAVVVCQPRGAAQPEKGVNYYPEFVCGIAIGNGKTYLLDIRPRSRAAWTTVAIRNVGTGAGAGSFSGVDYAPHLPTSTDFTGPSIRDTRLATAAYSLTRLIGEPHTIDVACWSKQDWSHVSGDSGDTPYATLAFWTRTMPHWVHLSPGVCQALETLLNHRPLYPNVITADAVETLTHEMMHAIGISNEAEAECLGMQLSYVLADKLGIPPTYSLSLARLNLANYAHRPPSYIDTQRCREGGQWDIYPNENSPPWNRFGS